MSEPDSNEGRSAQDALTEAQPIGRAPNEPQADPVDGAVLALVNGVGPKLITRERDRIRCMGLALEVLVERMMGDKRYFALVTPLFPLLEWSSYEVVCDEVYRAHVRELLDRALARVGLEPATRAEVLVAMAIAGPLAHHTRADRDLLLLLSWEIFSPTFCEAHGLPRPPAWTAKTHRRLDDLSFRLIRRWRHFPRAGAGDPGSSGDAS
jgi:hypothetical protein